MAMEPDNQLRQRARVAPSKKVGRDVLFRISPGYRVVSHTTCRSAEVG